MDRELGVLILDKIWLEALGRDKARYLSGRFCSTEGRDYKLKLDSNDKVGNVGCLLLFL